MPTQETMGEGEPSEPSPLDREEAMKWRDVRVGLMRALRRSDEHDQRLMRLESRATDLEATIVNLRHEDEQLRLRALRDPEAPYWKVPVRFDEKTGKVVEWAGGQDLGRGQEYDGRLLLAGTVEGLVELRITHEQWEQAEEIK